MGAAAEAMRRGITMALRQTRLLTQPKPTIQPAGRGWWSCRGEDRIGSGESPEAAWASWLVAGPAYHPTRADREAAKSRQYCGKGWETQAQRFRRLQTVGLMRAQRIPDGSGMVNE